MISVLSPNPNPLIIVFVFIFEGKLGDVVLGFDSVDPYVVISLEFT